MNHKPICTPQADGELLHVVGAVSARGLVSRLLSIACVLVLYVKVWCVGVIE